MRNSYPCCDESVLLAVGTHFVLGARGQVVIIVDAFCTLRTRPEDYIFQQTSLVVVVRGLVLGVCKKSRRLLLVDAPIVLWKMMLHLIFELSMAFHISFAVLQGINQLNRFSFPIQLKVRKLLLFQTESVLCSLEFVQYKFQLQYVVELATTFAAGKLNKYTCWTQDDGRDSITGFKGLSYCLGIAATHTAQGHLQCTYGRRAIVFRHEQYRERSSTDQLPKHRKILDCLCYRRMGTHRSLHQVVSCLDEAMRVREEMNDNGLKARIAKEVEANKKRIKKELEKQHVLKRKVEAINNLSEYVAQLRRISKGHAYTISSEPLGMNVPTPSAKAVSTYGFMYSGGRSVGDTIYKCMPCACRFSPEYVHDCLSISSEDKELAITDRVAASMYLS
ncbi:Rop guanine nucleotide exchange factor 3-like protein [Tanacetum coccineum]